MAYTPMPHERPDDDGDDGRGQNGRGAAPATRTIPDWQRYVAEVERAVRAKWGSRPSQRIACALVDVAHPVHLEQNGGAPVEVANVVGAHADADDMQVPWGGDQTLVIRHDATIVDLWLWARTVSQQIGSLCGRSGMGIGMGSIGLATSDGFCGRTVDLARQALRWARKNLANNSVFTADMARIAQVLQQVTIMSGLDAEQRHRELLSRIAALLGPVQTEHVTDHCQRVSGTCLHLGRTMGLAAHQIEQLRCAGVMHDVGKCMIPEQLLGKPRTLSIEEWQLMACHEDFGVWIAAALGLDDVTTNLIRNHHRRYDAWGPGAAQSATEAWERLGAAVLCVADALVTMLSNRPYRAACSTARALDELQRERGRQFDPQVVDAVQRLDDTHVLAA